jgi:hypothetical protein
MDSFASAIRRLKSVGTRSSFTVQYIVRFTSEDGNGRNWVGRDASLRSREIPKTSISVRSCRANIQNCNFCIKNTWTQRRGPDIDMREVLMRLRLRSKAASDRKWGTKEHGAPT